MLNETYHGFFVTLEVIFSPDGVTQKTSFGRLPMSCGQCNVANEPTNTETGDSLSPGHAPQLESISYFSQIPSNGTFWIFLLRCVCLRAVAAMAK